MRILSLDMPARTLAKLGARLLEQRFGKNSPLFASFFVTRRCNVRCDGCAYYENLDPALTSGDLPTADCLKILEGLAEGGVPIVQIVGGEPLLRRDLPLLLERGHSLGLALSVFTNGMPVRPAVLRSIDDFCTWASFSPHVPGELAGCKQDEQYARAWEGFALMRRELRRPKLVCNITVSRHTTPHMDELIRRSVDGGADSVKFQPNIIPSLFPAPEALAAALAIIEDWRSRHPRVIVAPDSYVEAFRGFFGSVPAVHCTATRRIHLGIQPDGTVSACCPELVPIGNLLRTPLATMLKGALESHDSCYGCQNLGILTTQRFAGA